VRGRGGNRREERKWRGGMTRGRNEEAGESEVVRGWEGGEEKKWGGKSKKEGGVEI